MNEELKEYIKKAKKRELLKRGLYDVKYYTKEEAEEAIDKNIIYNNKKYIEFIPYELTEEEFDQVIKYNYIRQDAQEYDVILNSDIYSQSTSNSILPIVLNILGGFLILLSVLALQLGVVFIGIGLATSIFSFALAKIIILLETRY